MNKDDMKLADEILDEAQINADDRNDVDLPEAPASATIRFWIRGYGVLFTMRDEKVQPLLKKVSTIVEYAESHNWKNTWDKEGTTPIERKVKAKVNQEECNHADIGQKKSGGFNKPENKGRIYNYCLSCNKFMGWKE